jgi:thymidine kinase
MIFYGKMSLVVYAGPMYASKTSKMIQEITRYADVSEKNHALIVNHKLDTRDNDHTISSHSSLYKGISDKIDIVKAEKLADTNVDKYVVIGVDEASFFEDLVETIEVWLAKGKHIVVSGLDSDYKMEKFGRISDLVHIADKFEKLNAICSVCLKEVTDRGDVISPFDVLSSAAPFTAKLPGSNDNLIDIGGCETYVATCRKHHKIQ